MNNEQYVDKVLDDFQKGKISREEAEKSLSNQPGVNAGLEIQQHKFAVAALQRYAVMQQVGKVHSEFTMHEEVEAPDKKSSLQNRVVMMRPMQWTLRVAAMLTFMAGGWAAYLFNTTDGESLYTEVYRPYYVSTERADSEAGADYALLVEEYRNKNYAAVINEYKALGTSDNREKFLTASAFHELGRYEDAAAVLKSILKSNEQSASRLYNDEAEFYLGLGYLKMDKNDEALYWLTKIYNDQAHTYHESVSRWLLIKLDWFN